MIVVVFNICKNINIFKVSGVIKEVILEKWVCQSSSLVGYINVFMSYLRENRGKKNF